MRVDPRRMSEWGVEMTEDPKKMSEWDPDEWMSKWTSNIGSPK